MFPRDVRAAAALLRAAVPLVAACALTTGAHSESAPGLTGTWLLDRSLSDDPVKVLRDSSSPDGEGLGRQIARSVSVFGIPVGRLPLPAGGDDEDEAQESNPETALLPIQRIRILQEPQAAEIEYDGSTTATYRYGVLEQREDRSVIAEWTGGALRIEHRLAGGTRLTEVYRFNAPAEQLEWTVRLKPKKGSSVEIERVFYRAREAARVSTGIDADGNAEEATGPGS